MILRVANIGDLFPDRKVVREYYIRKDADKPDLDSKLSGDVVAPEVKNKVQELPTDLKLAGVVEEDEVQEPPTDLKLAGVVEDDGLIPEEKDEVQELPQTDLKLAGVVEDDGLIPEKKDEVQEPPTDLKLAGVVEEDKVQEPPTDLKLAGVVEDDGLIPEEKDKVQEPNIKNGALERINPQPKPYVKEVEVVFWTKKKLMSLQKKELLRMCREMRIQSNNRCNKTELTKLLLKNLNQTN
jgi:hypothetical protein